MKFSKGLLKDKDIAKKMFKNSVSKSKALLTDVFGLTFLHTDPCIIEISEDDAKYTFSVVFKMNERIIKARLALEEEKDIIQEVLKIGETVEDTLFFIDMPSESKKAVDRVMDCLEKTYDIDFTPLNPEDSDSNIKEVVKNFEENIFKVVFTHDHHEAVFTAIYNIGETQVKIVKNNLHCIYLD